MESKTMQQSLDALDTTLNNVLIDVGKTLLKAKRDGRTALHPYPKIPNAMQELESAFHDALDNIEEPILRAKAVLVRDLENLRAKRAAAEPKPLPVLTSVEPLPEEPPSVPISIKKENHPNQFGGDGTSESTLDRLQESFDKAREIIKSPNTASKELSSTNEGGNPANQTTTPFNRMLPDESLFESPSAPKDQAEHRIPAEEVKPLGSVAEEGKARDGNTQELDLSKPNNEVSGTNANAKSTDIDSLFNGNNSTENDNLDFSDMFTAGGDFTFQENTTTQNNADLDSLMPGIESYAAVNQTEDFSMLDFPNNTDGTKGNGNTNDDTAIDDLFNFPDDNNASGNMEGNTNNNDLGITGESAFDDLLDDIELGDADYGTGGQAMEHGEFDDAFFGIG